VEGPRQSREHYRLTKVVAASGVLCRRQPCCARLLLRTDRANAVEPATHAVPVGYV
jgi:hypothetical protein